MIKYTAQSLLYRAAALADMLNATFISWGESYYYMNQAYRELYQDMINSGDTTYLTQVGLLMSGPSTFDLPEDCYQIAYIMDTTGVPIPRRRMDSSDETYGYSVVNNQLHVAASGNILCAYYPTPQTITTKASDIATTVPGTPISGWGDCVLLSDGKIWNIRTQSYVSSTTRSISTSAVLGAYSYIDQGTEYTYAGSVLQTGNLVFCSDGTFKSFSDTFDQAAANDDFTVICTEYDHSLYLHTWNGSSYDTTTVLDDYTGGPYRYIFWNGRDAIINNTHIIYMDGTSITTDVHGGTHTVLLKTDEQTGYGYLTQRGTSYYLSGFTPNTVIDYPNNILFDMLAYKIATQYKIKQNADSTQLQSAYDALQETYIASLSQYGDSYPTIRNVRSAYTSRFLYC